MDQVGKVGVLMEIIVMDLMEAVGVPMEIIVMDMAIKVF